MRKFSLLKPFNGAGEQGAAPLLIAGVVAIGLGTALYMAGSQTVNIAKHAQMEDGRDRDTEANISTTVYLKSAVQYAYVRSFKDELGNTVAGPDPADAAALPLLYPEPYWANSQTLEAGPLAPARPIPAGAMYSKAAGAALQVALPAGDKMHGTDYNAIARAGTVPNRAKSLTVQVTSAPGSIPDLVHPFQIDGVNIKLASQNSQSGWQHTSTAVIPLPRPGHARCKLNINGGPFGPNVDVPLTISVVGIAAGVYVPATAGDLYADPALMQPLPPGTFRYVDLRGETNSVRNTSYTQITGQTFKVKSPRILTIVDGDAKVVTVYAVVYIRSPDDTYYACGNTFQVKNVAGCRIIVDNYSIGAPTDPNAAAPTAPTTTCKSVTEQVADINGKSSSNLSFLSLFGGGSSSSSGGGTHNVTSWVCDSTPAAALPAADATNPGGLPLCATVGYTLSGAYDKSTMKFQVLDGANKDVTAATMKNANSSFCPQVGMKGHYQIIGSVSGPNNGGTPGTCLANIDVGAQGTTTLTGNSAKVPGDTSTGVGIAGHPYPGLLCPLFYGKGSSSAPKCQAINMHMVVKSTNWSADFNDSGFCPAKGMDMGGVVDSFETNFVASSPWTVYPCPDDARCFALEQSGAGTSHTLYAVVNNAYSANCQAVGVTRNELGCFDSGTLVRMGDGSLKRIDSVKEGQMVWNPATKRPAKVFEVTAGPEKYALIRLVTAHGEIVRVTREHPIPTRAGMKKAKAVQVGDEIQIPDGSWQKLTLAGPESSVSNQLVINLRLAPSLSDPAEHMLEAGGVITGDLQLQEQLAKSSLVLADKL